MAPRNDRSARRLIGLVLALAAAAGVAWWLFADGTPPAPDPFDTREDPTQAAEDDPSALTAAADEGGSPADEGETAGAGTRRSARPVTGIVTDERDAGIRGATVSLFPIDPRGVRGAPYRDGPVLAATTTEAGGIFSLPAPATGWLRVVASARGRATVGRRVAGPGARVVIPLPGAAALQVEVLGEAGAALPGARVQVQVDETRLAGETAADGTVRFTTLPPGTARVRVEAQGHGAVVAAPTTVAAGALSEVLVLLPRGVPVQGRVLDDETGSPIASAVVHVGRPGRSDRAAPTGPDGRFGPLPGGGVGERIFLAVEADGYAPGLTPVVLGASTQMDVELRVVRAEPWRGTVLDARGVPAVGAEVSYTADGIAGRAPASTRTDARGRFELPPPPVPAPGRRIVLAAHLGNASAALALRPGSLPPQPLELRLQAGSAVTGTVVDADGRPLAGVQVRLAPIWQELRDRNRPGPATSRLLLYNERGLVDLAGASGADGRWSIHGVAASRYDVRFAWPAGEHWREGWLEVGQGTTEAGVETLGSGGRLSGRLTDRTGAALAGATLRLVPHANVRRLRRVTSGADGWFEFGGLAGGRYLLRVAFGSLPTVEETITIEASGEQRLDVQLEDGAALTGQVHRADGSPYRGVLQVSLRREGRARPDRPPVGVRVKNGSFVLRSIPLGAWLVEARAPDGTRADAGLVDVDGGRGTVVRLTLERSDDVRGRVRTDDGRAVAGATVAVVHEATGLRHLVTADAAGRFVFPGLRSGTWLAEFSGRGGASARATFTVGSGSPPKLDLRLAPAGSARARVQDEQGRPVAQALVLFRLPEGGLATRTPARTDRAGLVLAHDLPPGRLRVTARTLDGRAGEAAVTITAGDVAQVELTVRARVR